MSPADDEDWEEDDGVDWDDEEAAEAEVDRIEAAMEAERPADAPRLDTDDPLIADAQFQAFQQGVPRWWLVVPPAPYRGEGEWRYADDEEAIGEEPAADDGLADEDELPAEAADGLEPEPEFAVQPEPEPAADPQPAQSNAAPYRVWRPSDDGRCQPFYGRACTF